MIPKTNVSIFDVKMQYSSKMNVLKKLLFFQHHALYTANILEPTNMTLGTFSTDIAIRSNSYLYDTAVQGLQQSLETFYFSST